MSPLPSCNASRRPATACAPPAPQPCLPAEVAALRRHCEWADGRIAQLVRRVGDGEAPLRAEAERLAQEAQALRVRQRKGCGCSAGRLATSLAVPCLCSPPTHAVVPQAEKESLAARLRELERSLGRIREGSRAEATQKRWAAGACCFPLA